MEIKITLTLDELNRAVKDYLEMEKDVIIPSEMEEVVVHSINPTSERAASLTWRRWKGVDE